MSRNLSQFICTLDLTTAPPSWLSRDSCFHSANCSHLQLILSSIPAYIVQPLTHPVARLFVAMQDFPGFLCLIPLFQPLPSLAHLLCLLPRKMPLLSPTTSSTCDIRHHKLFSAISPVVSLLLTEFCLLCALLGMLVPYWLLDYFSGPKKTIVKLLQYTEAGFKAHTGAGNTGTNNHGPAQPANVEGCPPTIRVWPNSSQKEVFSLLGFTQKLSGQAGSSFSGSPECHVDSMPYVTCTLRQVARVHWAVHILECLCL